MAVTLSWGAAIRVVAFVVALTVAALDAMPSSDSRQPPRPSAASRALDTPVVDHIPGGGPDGGWVSSLAITSTRPATVFAAFWYGGVFKSSDQGVTWTPADRGLPGDATCDLVSVPTEPDTLYAACSLDSLFKTTDGGALWRQLDLDYADVPIIAPSDPNVLYTPSWGGVVRSLDGGARWEHIATSTSTSSACLRTFVIDPVDSSTLFCGDEQQISVSRDAGVTWAPFATLPEGAIESLAVGPSDRRVMVAGTSDGRIFKTTDGGSVWQAVAAGPGSGRIARLWFADGSETTMFARQDSTILRSLDAGNRWQVVPFPWKASRAEALAVDPFSPSTLYVGARNGVMVTTDAGEHWDNRRHGITRSETSVVFQDNASSVVYARSWPDVIVSRNGGETWMSVAEADTGAAPTVHGRKALEMLRTPSGTTDGAFEFSTDGGQQWRSSRLPNGSIPYGIAVAAGTAGVVYVSVRGRPLEGGRIWRTTDAGDTWQIVFERPDFSFGRCCELVADPNDEDTVYAFISGMEIGAGPGGEIWRTTDGGGTWDRLSLRGLVLALALSPTTPTTVLVQHYDIEGAGRYVLVASTDRGHTWTRVGKGLPLNTQIINIAADPQQPMRVFAGTEGRGVFRSLDAGVTWEPTGLVR